MINFRKITEENFFKVINLKRPENETFVAPNLYSLAEAWLAREKNNTFPFAIYDDETIVGFMMVECNFEERSLEICRILFPEEYCHKGYGETSLRKVLELAIASQKFDKAEIDYEIGNDIAKHLYEKLGFKPIGIDEDNEVLMEMLLKDYQG